MSLSKVRSKTLVELAEQINMIITPPTEYDPKAVKKAFKGNAIETLKSFAKKLQESSNLHLPTDYHKVMEYFVKEQEIGFGKLGQPLRVALLGKMTGPGMDEVMAILGVDETVNRINRAIENIDKD